MRILLANKYNFLNRGADRYFLELARMLKEKGHAVAKFYMAHPKNIDHEWDEYAVSRISFNEKKFSYLIKSIGRILYSFEAKRKFRKLLADFKPDIVHIHNIYHQISPSILVEAKNAGVPVIMHLHDYKLICPNYQLFTNGEVCEKCKGGKFYNCAKNKCVKNSFIKSALASLEMYLHHKILDIYKKNIDHYIAPSEFMKKKMVEFGYENKRISVQPYFVANEFIAENISCPDGGTDQESYFLYFGALSKEKGIDALIKAFDVIKNRHAIRLKIVGDGHERRTIEKLISDKGLQKRVEMPGARYGEDLKMLIRDCIAVIVPSVWYEVTGMVNMEAGMMGKPVIAADIGGIGEVVEDNVTGLLFDPYSVKDLAEKMEKILSDKDLARQMGKAALKRIENNFLPEDHVRDIEKIYHGTIN